MGRQTELPPVVYGATPNKSDTLYALVGESAVSRDVWKLLPQEKMAERATTPEEWKPYDERLSIHISRYCFV